MLGRALLLLTFLCACGGKPPLTARARFYHSVVDAMCDRAVRCGVTGRSEESYCKTAGYGYVDHPQELYNPDQAITAGRLSIDVAAGEACASRYRNLSCHSTGMALGATCRDVFIGLVPTGSNCQGSLECSSGYCKLHDRFASCGGSCAAFEATGAPCVTLDACDSAIDFCADAPSPEAFTCARRATAALPCNSVQPQGARLPFPDVNPLVPSGCADGYICLSPGCASAIPPPNCDASICLVPGAIGASCNTGDHCADGLECQSHVCGMPLEAGQPCESPTGCADGLLCVGLSIEPGSPIARGRCDSVLDIGDECDPFASACPTDARCDSASGKCVELHGEGGGCPCRTNVVGPALVCSGKPEQCTAIEPTIPGVRSANFCD